MSSVCSDWSACPFCSDWSISRVVSILKVIKNNFLGWIHLRSFTMRLYGSLLIVPLVLIVVAAGNEYESFADEEDLPDSLRNFTWSCVIKSSQLNCSWSAHLLPADAQYSASVYLPGVYEDEHHLNCSSNHERERVECLGQIYTTYTLIVQVNISVSSQRHIMIETFPQAEIEILDPPKNISAEIKSKALEIKWSRTKSLYHLEDHCFVYQLNISGEIVSVEPRSEKDLSYTKQNIDLTRPYSIQMRTNVKDDCGGRSGENWSEWSESKVVGPREPSYQLNVYVIISIAFVLPMILLAVLLLCRFQRFSEKLFPSIPSPSAKVKSLLEKDDFSQVIPPKQCGPDAEEGTEIFQVTS